MSNEISNKNKLTNLLIYWSRKIKIFYMVFAVYFAILIAYDLIVYRRPFQEIITTYLGLIFAGIFIWFGLKLVIWFQIKNNMYREILLNIFSLIIIIGCGIYTLKMGFIYFSSEFTVGAFIYPIALTTVLKVQSSCVKNK